MKKAERKEIQELINSVILKLEMVYFLLDQKTQKELEEKS